ncbi:primase C-terminal domain-containing protein [Lonepinella sp. BR2271]|uniref:primase C-terminal domain-containing protein n=1 Tax=Lonepinella sp. BR2271 TaxID=3434550 RepID=UPI003F6DA6E8
MGVFTKNPNSDFWQTIVFNVPAYSLDYLADFVELSDKPVCYNDDEVVEGRNCDLFRQITRIGYREVLGFKKEHQQQEQFNQYLLSILEQLNQSQQPPLNYRELKSIAKSATHWIWERFSESEFKQIQSNRSKLRWKNQQIAKDELINKYGKNKPEIPLKKLAEYFNVSLATINRWAKEFGWVKSNTDSIKQSQLKYQQILDFRNQGVKWRDIAQKLSISEHNAKMCFKRYHQART